MHHPKPDHVFFVRLDNFKHQFAIVDQYNFAHIYVLRKLGITHVYLLHGPLTGFIHESDHIIRIQFEGVVGNFTYPEFGTL